MDDPGPQPDFALSVDGQNRRDVIAARLRSLKVTSTTGHDADELELVLDDRDYAIVSPRRGAVITVALGYVGAALTAHGAFTVDEVEASGPADTLTIKARATDVRAGLKTARNRSFSATTIGATVATIAADNALQNQVHPNLAGVVIEHRDQTGESDLHFLTRLAHDYDAVLSQKGGKLIMAPRSAGVTASGKALGEIALDRADLDSWKMRIIDSSAYGKIRARHHDHALAKDVYVEDGEGAPSHTLRHPFPTEAHARAAAKAHRQRLDRKKNPLELELKGRPEIFAGALIRTTGLRPEMNGLWAATKVEHHQDYAVGGYSTTIDAGPRSGG